ncbi:uroporphyrinogen decarboxylase family protein [Chloroflexota bacterium]
MMGKEWATLTPEEKRAERFKQWLEAPKVEFSSPEAKEAYRERVQRLQAVLLMKEPDRVPVSLMGGNFPIYYGGSTLYKAMYDYEDLCRAWRKFFYDFINDTDTFSGPGIYSAKVFEAIDYKMYKWPGNGLATDVEMFQFVEDEYMRADEYDDFIQDPSDYALRVFMPRTVGALEPLKNMVPFASIMGMGSAVGFVAPGANPDIRAAFQAIFDAGMEMAKWGETIGACSREILAAGFPSIGGGSALAPFDSIADILRGTSGASKDMYRQPDKLLEAMEKISGITIKQTIASANAFGAVAIGMPLHKGDDVFMSDKQFETFYWPTLKKVILAFIDEGLMVRPVAEGKYERRLEMIQDLPKGWCHWTFDETDMSRAKRIVGKNASISGIIPYSLMLTGTPQDIKEYCKKLIEVCGVDGGYILNGNAVATEKNPEKLRVFMQAAKEYGTYR